MDYNLPALNAVIIFLLDIVFAMPVSIRTCTDLKPLYLLNHAIPNRYNLPRGVSIVYDEEHSLHAYQLSEHAGNLNFEASDLFTRCNYWPEEYSILATFKLSPDSDTPTWENGYLFSLIPQTSVHLKLGISLSREKVTIFYSDYKIQPGKKSISFDSKLYDDKWHTIIVTVAGNQVGLRVDCGKTFTKPFERTFPAFLDTTGDNIHVGNRKIHPGQFRGMLKQLLVLPGADASQLACPTEMPKLPAISRQPDVQMMEADGPYKVTYQIPYDAECSWQETGKMWYDIYNQQLKVCHSGTWKLAKMGQESEVGNLAQPIPKLDYFDEFQNLRTPAPSVEIHTFTIPGDGQFVMTANYVQNKGKTDPSVKRRQKSMLYRWEDGKLQPYQNISCYGPSSFATFQVGKHFYMAVANLYASSPRETSEYVVVYKWHLRRKIFKPHQDLPASAPRDVEHFEIDGDHYLAVANHASRIPVGKGNNYTSDYNSRSFIWKFNRGTKNFTEFQKISTVGAWDWTHFSIRGEGEEKFHFLAVANTINNDREVTQASRVYYWSKQGRDGTGNFYPYQDIMTSGATDFEYFEINGDSFLAVSNSVGPIKDGNFNFETTSIIYKANKAIRQFEVFQEIPTYGILDWEYFTVGNDSYLIGSNQRPTGDGDKFKDTIIYRWKGAEKFVPAHKIQTDASADWEAIYDGMDTYLIYANGGGRTTEIYKAKLR